MPAPLDRRAAMQGAASALATPQAGGALASPARLKLRLMGTSDLHANIFPYDYYRDRPDDTVGLARTAGLIATARAEARNAILLDNGDIIPGGKPLGDYVALSRGLKKGDVHPMIAAMNELGYSACALGNHEFNYGLDFLDTAMAGANFPAVSCNIFKTDGSFYIRPWLVLEPTLRDEAGPNKSCASKSSALRPRKSCNGTRAIWPAASRRRA